MAAPVALAAGLFTYMVTRTIVSGEGFLEEAARRHTLFLRSLLSTAAAWRLRLVCSYVHSAAKVDGCIIHAWN